CSRSRWGRSTKSSRARSGNSRPPRKRREHPTTTPPKRTAADPSRTGGTRVARRSGLKSDRTDFAHESERQYARLLDFYQIEWDGRIRAAQPSPARPTPGEEPLEFAPHTERDVETMLRTIGAPSVDDLFTVIPSSIRLEGGLPIPNGLSEAEVLREMAALAAL